MGSCVSRSSNTDDRPQKSSGSSKANKDGNGDSVADNRPVLRQQPRRKSIEGHMPPVPQREGPPDPRKQSVTATQSQVDFFRILDEKIEQGTSPDYKPEVDDDIPVQDGDQTGERDEKQGQDAADSTRSPGSNGSAKSPSSPVGLQEQRSSTSQVPLTSAGTPTSCTEASSELADSSKTTEEEDQRPVEL